MLVHRVDVEQVVLHLSDDAPEHPQVAPEHRGLVHQPHGVGQPVVLHDDAAKGGAVDRVGAKLGVHHAAGVVQRAQRAARQALDAYRGLVQQESLQDRVRIAPVQVVAGDVDHARLVVEVLVDRPRFVRRRVQAFLEVQQQDLVELRDRLGGPVITSHQQLAGAHHGHLDRRGGLGQAVAERFGHRGLQVEHQPVLAPVGQQVQAKPDQPQQGFVALDLAHLERGGQALACQFVPVPAQPGRLGHPQDHLKVAQPAGRLLAVGLQRIRRVFELDVALAHLERLGHEEGLRIERALQLLAQPREQARITGYQP